MTIFVRRVLVRLFARFVYIVGIGLVFLAFGNYLLDVFVLVVSL